MVERVDRVREPGLLERPLRQEVLDLAVRLRKDASESLERDHVVFLLGDGAVGGSYERRTRQGWIDEPAHICSRGEHRAKPLGCVTGCFAALVGHRWIATDVAAASRRRRHNAPAGATLKMCEPCGPRRRGNCDEGDGQ